MYWLKWWTCSISSRVIMRYRVRRCITHLVEVLDDSGAMDIKRTRHLKIWIPSPQICKFFLYMHCNYSFYKILPPGQINYSLISIFATGEQHMINGVLQYLWQVSFILNPLVLSLVVLNQLIYKIILIILLFVCIVVESESVIIYLKSF